MMQWDLLGIMRMAVAIAVATTLVITIVRQAYRRPLFPFFALFATSFVASVYLVAVPLMIFFLQATDGSFLIFSIPWYAGALPRLYRIFHSMCLLRLGAWHTYTRPPLAYIATAALVALATVIAPLTPRPCPLDALVTVTLLLIHYELYTARLRPTLSHQTTSLIMLMSAVVMILPWLPGVANILLPAAAETTASVTTYILEPAYIALYTIIIILIGKGLIEASPRNYA